MNVKLINPFIESVYELFATMLNCGVSRGDVTLSKLGGDPKHLVALIGLSGPARGTVALSLPVDTSLQLTGRLLGPVPTEVNDDVADAVAEMANMIAGSAKAKLGADTGTPINLGLPTVVTGSDYKVVYPSDTVWLDVPFQSELGQFSLRVTFEFSNGGA
ncbi:MAG: chemotaxis protein CheX [Fimbriimonadaceae bacterium]|nr:chemotaxis protein CheX [Fimbriimonadaceae bacterium]